MQTTTATLDVSDILANTAADAAETAKIRARLSASEWGQREAAIQTRSLAANIDSLAFAFAAALRFARDGMIFEAGEYVGRAEGMIQDLFFCEVEHRRALKLWWAVREAARAAQSR
jgi:hypothetical protein